MQNGKIMLPFSVQVNHAFVDGVHVGKYVGRLQHFLDETGS
jgi:chloramphenicol O-acetyltransferase